MIKKDHSAGASNEWKALYADTSSDNRKVNYAYRFI